MIPKFRAWDKRENTMRDVAVLHFTKGGKVNSIEYWKTPSELKSYHVRNLILMQFTGLKDKNGVEIFEGDICNLSGGLDDYWYIVEWLFAGWQLVTYKKPDAKVRGISDGINQCYLEPSIANNLAIVGNIYANPELLSSGIE